MAVRAIFTITNCYICTFVIFFWITIFFWFHDLNFIVNSQIIKVIKVASAVIWAADPVKVSTAIISPTSVQLKFNVSFIASTI